MNRSAPLYGRVLFLPGDGGWRGFAVDIAEKVASWGYVVCGMDTRKYLENFTQGNAVLKEEDVVADLHAAAAWMRDSAPDKTIYVGWSEGANLGVLATSHTESTKAFRGFVAIGLGESGILRWRWQDYTTWVTKKRPDEPRYQTAPHIPRIAPLPFFMIHASQDEYTSVERAKELFASAGEPKQLRFVQARDHRFAGGRDEFFRVLQEALEWIRRMAP
ncbi:MAG: alpha/beta hydrolase [Acidobacteriales bacterium]|nr:alpha/beta hydrolase [Terriglobales bacterium]